MNRVKKACAGQWIAVLRRPLLYAMGCLRSLRAIVF